MFFPQKKSTLLRTFFLAVFFLIFFQSHLYAQSSQRIRLSKGQEYITSYRDLINYYSLDPVVASAGLNKDGLLIVNGMGVGATVIYLFDGAGEKSIEVEVVETERPIYGSAGRIEKTYSPDYHRLSASVNALYNNDDFFYDRRYVYSAEFNFPTKKNSWLRSETYVRQDIYHGAYLDTLHVAYERPHFEAVLGDDSINFGLFNSSIMSGLSLRGLTFGFFPQYTGGFPETADRQFYAFGGIRQPYPGESVVGTKESEYGGGINWQDSLNDQFKYSVALGHFNYEGKKGHPLMLATSQEYTPNDEIRIANTFLYNKGVAGLFFEPAFKYEKFAVYPFYDFLQNGLGAPFTTNVEQNTKHRYGIQVREFLRDGQITLTQGFRQVFNRPNADRNLGEGRDETVYVGSSFQFPSEISLNANYQFNKSFLKDSLGGTSSDNTGHALMLYYRDQLDEDWSLFSTFGFNKTFSKTMNNSTYIDFKVDGIRRSRLFLFTASMEYHRRSFGRTVNIYSPGVSFGFTPNYLNLQYYLYWNIQDQFPKTQYYLNSLLNAVFRPTEAHELSLNIGTTVDVANMDRSLTGYFYISYALRFGHGVRSRSILKMLADKVMPHTVQGSVFVDANKNLVFDPNETGLQDVKVQFLNGEAFTNRRGFYSVKYKKQDPAGEVFVEAESIPEEYQFASENRRNFDFGEKKANYFDVPLWKESSQVDIVAYEDIDGDGIYSQGVDLGVSNVPFVIRFNGKELREKTDMSGIVYLMGIEAKDLSAYVDLGRLPEGVEIYEGEEEKNIVIDEPGYFMLEFRMKPTRAMSGKVFFDDNKDGKFNEGDLPAPDIRVSVGSVSAITDESGNYSLSGIVPGEWTVSVSGATKGRRIPSEMAKKTRRYIRKSQEQSLDIPLQ